VDFSTIDTGMSFAMYVANVHILTFVVTHSGVKKPTGAGTTNSAYS